MLVKRLPFPMRRAPQTLLRCLTIGVVTVALLLSFTGCASKTKPTAATPAAARSSVVVGEIAIVDEEKRFVLIDLDSNLSVPPPGAALHSTNAAGETAHFKASLEQKRPFIAADIIDGAPAVGDEVMR